jgi:hypothetical protein
LAPVNFKIQRGINSYSMEANFALCSKYRASKMRTKGCKNNNESFLLKCALYIYKKTTGIADLHQKAVPLLERGVYIVSAKFKKALVTKK